MGDGGGLLKLAAGALLTDAVAKSPPKPPRLKKLDEQDEEETSEAKRRARERQRKQALARFGGGDTLLTGSGGLGGGTPAANRSAPTLGGG